MIWILRSLQHDWCWRSARDHHPGKRIFGRAVEGEQNHEWAEKALASVDCTQSLSVLVHSNWETGASERHSRAENGEEPRSLQARARSCISLAPVSQLLWTRKERDCVQSIASGYITCSIGLILNWLEAIFNRSSRGLSQRSNDHENFPACSLNLLARNCRTFFDAQTKCNFQAVRFGGFLTVKRSDQIISKSTEKSISNWFHRELWEWPRYLSFKMNSDLIYTGRRSLQLMSGTKQMHCGKDLNSMHLAQCLWEQLCAGLKMRQYMSPNQPVVSDLFVLAVHIQERISYFVF